MKILIVGNGGREHALLWKLAQDAPGAEFFITRGNGGTVGLATALPLAPTEILPLAAWAEANVVDLTVVGPEAPLAEGIVDVFLARGLTIFGPQREATSIEASKSYAKSLMRRGGVPTARFETFTSTATAEAYIREHGAPIVVKASGLAAGKGAVVCHTVDDAVVSAHAMLAGDAFGAAGREIVVEECLEGEELSVFTLTDGIAALPMRPAQDYKRIGAGDTGPNTGGMGAYAPVSVATGPVLDQVGKEIVHPTLAMLREDGRPFRGLLYVGLMLTAEGPRVIEFNARFGDPETQAVLPLLRSSLLDPMLAIASGDSLADTDLAWRPEYALTTVVASAGYPGAYEKGKEIVIPDEIEEAADLLVFHAGTARQADRLVTSGGRVLAVTALAPTIESAAERSREAAEAIAFEGKQFRPDIGWRELERRAAPARPPC